jgi:hypothetical protein
VKFTWDPAKRRLMRGSEEVAFMNCWKEYRELDDRLSKQQARMIAEKTGVYKGENSFKKTN